MKEPVEFVKTTLIGGALVIVPVVLVLLVIIETVDMVAVITDPIVEQLPVETLGGIEIANILAVLLILAACFLAGLAARSTAASAVGRRFESTVLAKLPMYGLIKTVTRSFSPTVKPGDKVRPATLRLADDTWTLVAVIEEHDDGHATVFVPGAPMPTIGQIRFVHRDQLRPVDASLGDVANVLMQWGYGGKDLFEPPSEPRSS